MPIICLLARTCLQVQQSGYASYLANKLREKYYLTWGTSCGITLHYIHLKMYQQHLRRALLGVEFPCQLVSMEHQAPGGSAHPKLI
jgi:glutathione peroxidase-family protein